MVTEFYFFKIGAVVHVFKGRVESRLTTDTSPPMLRALAAKLKAYCGATSKPMERNYTMDFEDDELCAKCYAKVPEEFRSDLFHWSNRDSAKDICQGTE